VRKTKETESLRHFLQDPKLQREESLVPETGYFYMLAGASGLTAFRQEGKGCAIFQV